MRAPDPYAITTIVTAAASTGLTTRETVKDELQITDRKSDTYIDRQIRQVTAAIQNYCNRVFAQQTYQDEIRLDRWGARGYSRGIDPLELARWPVTSIASVTETGFNGTATVLVAGTDYELRADTGQLFRLSGNIATPHPITWPRMKEVVIYAAGYTLPGVTGYTLPPDIEDAAIRLIKKAWFGRTRDPLVRQESVPEIGETQYWVSGGNDGNFPPDVTDILDNYRVPLVG